MAETHRILRMEHTQDRQGNDEIFCVVEVTTDTDVFTRAEWLTPLEVKDILAEAEKPQKEETKLSAIELVALTKVQERAVDIKTRAILLRPAQLAEIEAAKVLPVLAK